MAKSETRTAPIITFTGGDYKPKRLASGLIGFRAPFDIRIEPGKSQIVELKTKCSVYLLFPSESKGAIIVEPQTDIVVSLTAAELPLVILTGEIVVRAMPLFPPSYDIE